MMKEDHPAVFDAMGSVPAQYAGYSSDGRIYGADPLVAGLLTCGATGHGADGRSHAVLLWTAVFLLLF